MEEKLIDMLWEIKEGKKHPNRAYKELCVLFNVVAQSERSKSVVQLKEHCRLEFDEWSNIYICDLIERL